MSPAFDSVLVANRGEIAVTGHCALCVTLGCGLSRSTRKPTATRATSSSPTTRCASARAPRRAATCGSTRSSTRRGKTGAGAVHPGYGFLSERPAFVEACEAAGLVFIGPSAENMRLAGSKLGARAAMQAAGVPVIPGSQRPLLDASTAAAVAGEVGYPLMLKASAGGGGRGMRIVDGPDTLADEFPLAQGEARAAFGDPTLYVERLIEGARHIEVQVLGDGHGQAVHLGERNCSVQRRHQKMIEEAPSPSLNRATAARAARSGVPGDRRRCATGTRPRSSSCSIATTASTSWRSTPVFRSSIQSPRRSPASISIRAQIEIATTGRLPFDQADIDLRGHAIECRINAEDPDTGFLPQPGVIERLAHARRYRRSRGLAPLPGLHRPRLLRLAGGQADRPRQHARRRTGHDAAGLE